MSAWNNAHASTQDTVGRTDTIWVIADGDSSTWASSAAPDWDMIDELTHDTDGTYIQFDNTAGQTYEWFTLRDWYPEGLVEIDSFKMVHADRETNASANGSFSHMTMVRGQYYPYDTITPSGTTYTTTSGRAVTVNPYTTSDWLYEDFNDIQIGFHTTTATSGSGLYTRVSNLFVVVWWQQQVIYDTISTLLYDGYVRELYRTLTFATSTVLQVGDVDGGNCRAVYTLDTTLLPFHAGYSLDTALLIFKSQTVGTGAPHILNAYISHRSMCSGAVEADTQTDAVCWRDYRYKLDSTYKWQVAGADSTENVGGTDRSANIIGTTTHTTAGLDTINVFDWIYEAKNFGTKFAGASCQSLNPVLIIKRATEGQDSAVAIYTRNDGTSSNRPYIFVRVHNAGDLVGYTTTSSGDSLIPGAVSGTGWSNIVNDTIKTSDDRDTRYSGTTQPHFYARQFGFTWSPSSGGTLTVDSIRVYYEGQGNSSTLSRRQVNFRLMKAGVPVGDSVDITLNNGSDASSNVYPSTRPTWNTTWTEADLENTGFGIRMMDANTGTAASLDVDALALRVWFRETSAKAKVIIIGQREDAGPPKYFRNACMDYEGIE